MTNIADTVIEINRFVGHVTVKELNLTTGTFFTLYDSPAHADTTVEVTVRENPNREQGPKFLWGLTANGAPQGVGFLSDRNELHVFVNHLTYPERMIRALTYL